MLIAAVMAATFIGGAWYLLIERSAIVARAVAEAREASLAPGDEITTREGFPLRVVEVAGTSVIARAASGAHIRVNLDAILERRSASAVADANVPAGALPAATRALLDREFSEAASRWFGLSASPRPSTGPGAAPA